MVTSCILINGYLSVATLMFHSCYSITLFGSENTSDTLIDTELTPVRFYKNEYGLGCVWLYVVWNKCSLDFGKLSCTVTLSCVLPIYNATSFVPSYLRIINVLTFKWHCVRSGVNVQFLNSNFAFRRTLLTVFVDNYYFVACSG